MHIRFAASLAALAVMGATIPASATDLPAIKATDSNTVPACVTPGRLAAFLKSRNGKLDPRFETIATEYMRHGEELGLRWDYAFFQMLLETGNLTFTGDVQPKQNNFAGLGATGRHEPGESFKDISTGVRAHLEHVLMYSGQHIDNPVAERTRKVQEWGVLTGWQKTIKGSMTYAQLARQWAPKSKKYTSDIDSVADAFFQGACKGEDAHPEWVQEARAGRGVTQGTTKVAEAPTPEHEAATEIRKRAVEEQRAEGGKRSGLGLTGVAKAAELPPAAAKPEAEPAQPKPQPAVTILNGPKTEAAKTEAPKSEAAKAEPEQATKTSAAEAPKGAQVQTAAVTVPSKPSAPAAKSKCNVWTASYGGQKAIIIRAITAELTNYTVLDVNEGAEKREADAYIAAYAKGGQMVGEFQTSDQALDKAFELCPEG